MRYLHLATDGKTLCGVRFAKKYATLSVDDVTCRACQALIDGLRSGMVQTERRSRTG